MLFRSHETTLEVNLNAVVANLNYYRSFMKPETKLVCMIKADGYGAGAVEIAKTLQDHRVDYLAVAVADEGQSRRHPTTVLKSFRSPNSSVELRTPAHAYSGMSIPLTGQRMPKVTLFLTTTSKHFIDNETL